MKKRYFIYFSYNGAAYVGWQMQHNGISVQEVMQKAFSTVLRHDVEITAAGRTDSGVHARNMVAHLDLENDILSETDFVNKMNSLLPQDIALHKIIEVKPDAHARFDAVSRRYEYHLIVEKNVFLKDFAMRIFQPLDFNAMNMAAETLYEYTDFTSFSKLHTDVFTNNCKVSFAEWTFDSEKWIFTIEADRFLRNMVRAIVVTLIEVGRGKMTVDDFRKVIEAKNRNVAGASVPAKGLYLMEVKYPAEVFQPKINR
ncbi:MAG: tRNA pseudouridine(38-40) synthase TruA [Porphyromonadaceae bacterium]|nr:tRNA pseudouridine(38-40) synthase TruA [Porphyromonadaceae bacterium]